MPLDCTPERGRYEKPDRSPLLVSLDVRFGAVEFLCRTDTVRAMEHVQCWSAKYCNQGHTHIAFWELPGHDYQLYQDLWAALRHGESIEGPGFASVKEIYHLPADPPDWAAIIEGLFRDILDPKPPDSMGNGGQI